MNQLTITHLSKAYQGKNVIQPFSCQFGPGCYAILGPNGTGKSTLLSLLAGIISPNTGSILINGFNLEGQSSQAKKLLGYVPDQAIIYPFITGREFLNFVGYAKNKIPSEETKSLLQAFEAEMFLDIKFQEMSFGTQKKFFLIAALINQPPVLLLDEPTNALDKNASSFLISTLNHLKKESIVLFSTHDAHLIESTQAQKLTMPFKQFEHNIV